MLDLPQLAVTEDCPGCPAQIGQKHHRTCGVAICVTTGVQRLLHIGVKPDQPMLPPPPFILDGVPVDAHVCGDDVWTGHRHGAAEAAAAGLFVRERQPGEPDAPRWIPCRPGTPGAQPDVDRVTRTGTWDPITQRWEISEWIGGGDG